jgi:hypothetical protein
MKKEKSKVFFSILSISITVLLILNIYFESKRNECIREVDEKRINITPLYQELNFAWSNFHFVYTQLNVLNHTKLDYTIKDGKCSVTLQNDLPNECIKDWREWPLEIQTKINTIESDLNKSLSDCDNWSLWVKSSLCLALILSLFTLFYGWFIYKMYKI